jgi:hypothetical protein
MSGSGRTPIHGPEPWRTKRNAVWSYRDLWFAVLVVYHDGDLNALAAAIEDGGRSFWSGTVEAKLSLYPEHVGTRTPPTKSRTTHVEEGTGHRARI